MLGHDSRGFRVGENLEVMLHKSRSLERALESLKDGMKPIDYLVVADKLHRLSDYLESGRDRKALQQCHTEGFSRNQQLPQGRSLLDWSRQDDRIFQHPAFFQSAASTGSLQLHKLFRLGTIVAACKIQASDPTASVVNLRELVELIVEKPTDVLAQIDELLTVGHTTYWNTTLDDSRFCHLVLTAILPEKEPLPHDLSVAMSGAARILDEAIRNKLSRGDFLPISTDSRQPTSAAELSHQPSQPACLEDSCGPARPSGQPLDNVGTSSPPLGRSAIRQGWAHTPDEPVPPDFQYGPLQGRVKEVVPAVLGREGKGNPRLRKLETKGRNKVIWIMICGKQDIAVYFKNEQQHDQAKERFDAPI